MYKIRTIRTRKCLNDCTPDHRARMNTLMDRACQHYLREPLPDAPSSSMNNGEALDIPFSNLCDSELDDRVIQPEFCSSLDRSDSSVGNEASDCETVRATVSENVEDFESSLATVFAEENMSHKQIKAVSRVIKTHSCFSDIHADPRTVMKTPVYSAPTTRVAGGEYLHLGVEKALRKILTSTPPQMQKDIIQIDFSTDEASLDETGQILMWSIQIRIANMINSSPEIVGIFKGSTKPSDSSTFFQPFVQDLQSILQNGINFMNQDKFAYWRCFIADAPALAFSLGHRSHNSRVPCSRCWVRGEHIRSEVMVFNGTDHRPQTQEEYSSRIDIDHHIGAECPLGDLSFNLIRNTVFDYMHLVCLGVMEKFLLGVIDGRIVKSAIT